MIQYINKSALVTKIENLIKRAEAERALYPQTIKAAKNYLLIEDYKKLLSIIDTIEVKEVDVDLGDSKGDKSMKYIIDTKTSEVKEMENDIITEDYVSFKTAKLLKEKGFNETSRAFWKDWNGQTMLCHCSRSHVFKWCNNSMLEKHYNDNEETNIAAPTLQMACKWLREIHG